MSGTSVLQTLPPHIILMVVEFIVNTPFRLYHYNDDFDVKLGDLQPLFSLCQQWRRAALSMAFSECRISPGSDPVLTYPILDGWAYSMDRKQHLELVKHVRIMQLSTELDRVLDSKELSKIQQQFNEQLPALPKTRFLEIKLGPGMLLETRVSPAEASQRVARFLDLLRAIALGINYVTVHVRGGDKIELGAHGLAFNKLVCGLLSGWGHTSLARLDIEEASLPSGVFVLPPVAGLTSLSCQWSADYKSVARLAQINSMTLTELSINHYHYKDMARLIFNDTGHAVVYSSLQRLRLWNACDDEMEVQPPYNKNIVPFPKLNHMEITTPYPFSDEIPFRDNCKHLRHLVLNASHSSVKMLETNGVLCSGQMPSLRGLSFQDTNTEEDAVVPRVYIQFIKGCMSVLQRLYIKDPRISLAFVSSISNTDLYSRLRNLSIGSQYLTLSDLTRLLGQLPLLECLVSKVSRLGDEYLRMSIIDVAGLIRSRYRRLNQRFRQWIVLNSGFFQFSSILTCILLLADVCVGFEEALFLKQEKTKLKRLFRHVAGYRLYQIYEHEFTLELDPDDELPVVKIKRQ